MTLRAFIASSRRAAFHGQASVRWIHLADDDREHAVKQVALVADVAIEGHRVDTELPAEPGAIGERDGAAAVGQLDGGRQARARA